MSSTPKRRITPVILSGGAGTRLWPMSRIARPKQLLALTGAETMLQMTAMRTRDAALFGHPIVVANALHADEIEAQLGAVGLAPILILEPSARNTAPAIALAALHADADDLLLIVPSDHLIADTGAFHAAVEKALPFAVEDWLVTFGMHAERPETGYGYIQRGEALAPGVDRARRFVEKPDLATAQSYCADGGYSWNGGIFLFRAGACLAALEAFAPDILGAARAAMDGAAQAGSRVHPDAARFRASPAQSIDYAVMEKADRVAVVPVAMGWSDVGSWDALYEVADKDADGNAVAGEALAIRSADCLIRSDGPLIAAIGVKDLVIIATGKAVLVVPRGESQSVREAVDALKAKEDDRWT